MQLLFGQDGWGPLLLKGAGVTILLAVASAPFGFGAGLLLALMRMSGSPALRRVSTWFTTVFRGIPDLLSLFIVYFGLQAALNWIGGIVAPGQPVTMDAFVAGALSLAVVVAAYSGEVWIAALHAVPSSQRDAAEALGLSRRQAFALVTLPQLGRVALPGLGNIWTLLLKDTSLISTLAVSDLLRAASEASRSTLRPLLFYGAAAGIYLVFSIASGGLQSVLERRANRGYA